MLKTTHATKYNKPAGGSTSVNALCGRMVNYMGITQSAEEVTCKGCRKNLPARNPEWTMIRFACDHKLLINEESTNETIQETGRWPRRTDSRDCPNCR